MSQETTHSHHPPADRNEGRLVGHLKQVHRLLAKNPNYFGNLPGLGIPPVWQIVADTYVEELTGVGLSPDQDVREATFRIRLTPMTCPTRSPGPATVSAQPSGHRCVDRVP